MFQKSRLFYTFAEKFPMEWHTATMLFMKKRARSGVKENRISKRRNEKKPYNDPECDSYDGLLMRQF